MDNEQHAYVLYEIADLSINKYKEGKEETVKKIKEYLDKL